MRKISYLLIMMLLLSLGGCAMEVERKGIDVKKASAANANLGVAYLSRGNYEYAMNKLKKAIKYDDDNANAHSYIGELYRRLGENDLAREHFEKAMDLAPDDSSIKNNYGVFLCGAGAYGKGMKYLSEALADPLYGDKGRAYENMGICSQNQGNIKKSEEYFTKALTLNENLPASLLGLAQIEFDKQHIKIAASYLDRYNKIAPHTPQSLWLGVLIERKRGHKGKAGSYAVFLKGKFPESKEAMLLEKLERR